MIFKRIIVFYQIDENSRKHSYVRETKHQQGRTKLLENLPCVKCLATMMCVAHDSEHYSPPPRTRLLQGNDISGQEKLHFPRT